MQSDQICRVIWSNKYRNDGVESRTPIALVLLSLMIQWNLDCWSRKEKWKNKPITMFEWFLFRFYFRFWQSSFPWMRTIEGIVSGIGKTEISWFFRLQFGGSDHSAYVSVLVTITTTPTPTLDCIAVKPALRWVHLLQKGAINLYVL